MPAHTKSLLATLWLGPVVLLLTCLSGVYLGVMLGAPAATPASSTPCTPGRCGAWTYQPPTYTPEVPDRFTLLVLFVDNRENSPQLEGTWIYRHRRGAQMLFVMGLPNDLWVACPDGAEMRLSDVYASAAPGGEQGRTLRLRDCVGKNIDEPIDRTATVSGQALDEIVAHIAGSSGIAGAAAGSAPSQWWHPSDDSLETLRRQMDLQSQLIALLTPESAAALAPFSIESVRSTGYTDSFAAEAADLLRAFVETRDAHKLYFAPVDATSFERFTAPDGRSALRLKLPFTP